MTTSTALAEIWRSEGTFELPDLLSAVRQHLGMDVGFVSHFADGRRVFDVLDGKPHASLVAGGSDPLDETYCHYIASGAMPELIIDAALHPIGARLAVTRAMPIGSHLSVPIRLDDGRVHGTLCCFSACPDPSLGERDLSVLRMCSELVGRLIQKEEDRRTLDESRRARIKGVLGRGGMAMVFQPIWRLADDRLMSMEALARFPGPPHQGPDRWFADAEAVGLGPDLEYLAVEKALEALALLPPGVSLSVNLSPAAILDPRLGEVLAGQPLRRLILEVTEHAAIQCYAELNATLRAVRAAGLRLAIDDVGAGHSSFRHVLELRPDLIKLDISICRNIDRDAARQALAESVIAFARKMGCEVVAEGVETVAELLALRAIGITKVQGYLTGRPSQIETARALPRFGGSAQPLAADGFAVA